MSKALDERKVVSLLNKAVKPAKKPKIETIKRGKRTYYRLYLGVDENGKAVRPTVGQNKREAEAIRLRFEERMAKGDLLAAKTGIEIESDLEIQAAKEKLAPYGATITEAVGFYINHSRPSKARITVSEAWKYWLQEQKRIGNKTKTLLRAKDTYLGPSTRFGKHFKDEILVMINRQQIEDFVFGVESWSRNTKAEHLKKIKNFFNSLAELGWCSRENNPCNGIRLPKNVRGEDPDPKEPVYRVTSIASMLEFALQSSIPTYRTYGMQIIFVGFCGVRIEETLRMRWKHLLHKRKPWAIKLPAQITKKNWIRRIEIPENARCWLSEFVEKHTWEISPEELIIFNRNTGDELDSTEAYKRQYNFRKAWRKWTEKNKKPFESEVAQNALRHSCASYSVHEFGKEKTCAMMGEKDPSTLDNHYRYYVEPEDAKKYFEILPPREIERRKNTKQLKKEKEMAQATTMNASRDEIIETFNLPKDWDGEAYKDEHGQRWEVDPFA